MFYSNYPAPLEARNNLQSILMYVRDLKDQNAKFYICVGILFSLWDAMNCKLSGDNIKTNDYRIVKTREKMCEQHLIIKDFNQINQQIKYYIGIQPSELNQYAIKVISEMIELTFAK